MNYSSKKAQILNVLSWSAKDWIDTYYFDESGFSLDSNIPYYWSPVGVGTQRIWPARAFTLGHLTHNDLASVRIAKRATKSL